MFIYVPHGTYSKYGMNKIVFTQYVDLFRETFIYFTQHYTRNAAISQEKVLSAHTAAFSLSDSSHTSADAAPLRCANPRPCAPRTLPLASLVPRALRAPSSSTKNPENFLPGISSAYSFSLFSSSVSSPSSGSSSGTSSGSFASDASSAAASAS